MWEISTAVVVDDALGPPGEGSLHSDDKNAWIDFVSADPNTQAALLATFAATGLNDLDDLLGELTSHPDHIAALWTHYNNNTLATAGLELLFKTFALDWTGKAQKPLAVCAALASFVGAQAVKKFWRMEDATAAVAQADVAFIDFFLNDNEGIPDALQRIRNHKADLGRAKLLFIMSSRAAIDTQQQVRKIVGLRTAFFEVMAKTDVETAWVIEKIRSKSSSYLGNKSLENVARELVAATHDAAKEFNAQCDDLEIHDLRLFDLARLVNEGESIAAYLTWLSSESIAAKIRRISSTKIKNTAIDAGAIGFTGQIKQGKVLFDLFSEVVFGPGHQPGEPLHFGEVLVTKPYRRRPSRTPLLSADRAVARSGSQTKHTSPMRAALSAKSAFAKRCVERDRVQSLRSLATVNPQLHEPARYLLVLTPACDLARCSPLKMVLCVEGTAQDMSDVKVQAREKLYGKHSQGLRHLLTVDGQGSPVLITWHKNQSLMLSVRDIMGGNFKRLAQMNELYAQEVKEEVLRELGRIGTQIDPPPAFALHATLKWKVGSTPHEAATGDDSFFSAILSYSEQSDDKSPTVILSDEFKKWASAKVQESLNGQPAHAKLQNSLNALTQSPQFILKPDLTVRKNELLVRVLDEANSKSHNGVLLELILSSDLR
ncbi:hypothetical protein MCEMSHM24_03691 [Comamonadaceae bacterium]